MGISSRWSPPIVLKKQNKKKLSPSSVKIGNRKKQEIINKSGACVVSIRDRRATRLAEHYHRVLGNRYSKYFIQRSWYDLKSVSRSRDSILFLRYNVSLNSMKNEKNTIESR